MASLAHQKFPTTAVGYRQRRGWLSNVAFTTPEHLIHTIRHGLRSIQYRSNLIDGCLPKPA